MPLCERLVNPSCPNQGLRETGCFFAGTQPTINAIMFMVISIVWTLNLGVLLDREWDTSSSDFGLIHGVRSYDSRIFSEGSGGPAFQEAFGHTS